MPLSIDLAHKLAIEMVKVRKKNIIPFLCPDGKTQVSLQYENNKVKRVDSIVISQQHDKAITSKDLYSLIHDEVIKKVIPLSLIDFNTRILINPSGSFICGGTTADTGLTGRKIIVDTYGGHVNHGGGAFSGKDPTKVDRSAAYALRYIAKHIIAADFAEKILLQAAYVIGKAEPLSFFIDTFGTEKIKLSKIELIIHKFFDLKVGSIINQLDLLKPIYKKSATFGHFGRSEFPWEKLNLINLIKDFNFD
jgi:S-adenosylmethionine synthetase